MVLKGRLSPTLTQTKHVSGSTHLVGLRAIALMSPIGREGEVVSHRYFVLI